MTLAPQPLPLTATVTPPDHEAVAGVIRKAHETGTAVYPTGGGTMLGYGATAAREGVGLSLLALSRVVDYPARDLTITVEAGVSIAEISRCLAGERQRLPVDVADASRATIGGVVATSPTGARRFRWGTMRDYVIGLKAVDGQGQSFSGGGRVVKNAAGYDLPKLLTGSLGTLGVITQVTLMVKPMPETSAFVACDVADFPTLERLLADLAKKPVYASAIEFLAGEAWDLSTNANVGRLMVGFEGAAAEVDGMASALAARWQSLAVSPSTYCGDAADRLWQQLTDGLASATHNNGQQSTLVEVRVLPSAVMRAIEVLRHADPNGSLQSHAGDGIVKARLTLPVTEVVQLLDSRFRKEADGCHAAVILSHPADAALSRNAVWGPPASAHRVMQSLKTQFDPKGILNPGRFVF
jgi:glycolate oxidase FAD binding subunit